MSDQLAPVGGPPPVHLAASPLAALFGEERHGDRQAREAVFCTFNADLGFFERTILGVTQATGARTTVVGDAQMSDPDPRAARNAGIRYVHGVAATAGAFHPKLIVVAGPRRCLLAAGSGNLSVGGWQLNAETWTIATADPQRCPTLVAQAATWLRALDDACVITPSAADGLKRTAKMLETLAAAAEQIDTGHRLVDNLRQPIIDQLPSEPVEALSLCAPFHDEHAAAVRALLERYAPLRVSVSVQPGHTVVQPAALARLFDEFDLPLTVHRDADRRYRHGKLVEAVTTTGARWTLTGSPNLSAAALLNSVADGGNVELGVVTLPSDSLFPGGPVINLTDVPAVSIASSAAARVAPPALVTEAVSRPDGLHLTFSRPTRQRIRIAASTGSHYDGWTDLGEVPTGTLTWLCGGVTVPGGSRVRMCWEADGQTREGPVTFVIDPHKVMLRVGGEHGGNPTSQGPLELLADPRLVQRWLDAVAQLTAANRVTALPRVAGGQAADGSREPQPRADTDPEDWLTYCDDARFRLGPKMFHLALGGLSAVATVGDVDVALLAPTDRLVDERTPGLEDDDPDSATDDLEPAAHAGSGDRHDSSDETDRTGYPEVSEPVRRAARRELRRAVRDRAPHLAAVDRLAIGTLVLTSIELDIWDGPDGADGWVDVLAGLLAMLDLGDVPPQLEASMASFAAVALYLTRDHLPADEHTSAAAHYQSAAAATSHLLAAADIDLVAAHADGIRNSRGFPIDPDEVMRVIALIVQDDPLTDAVESLDSRHADWKVHRHDGNVLHVHGSFRNPYLAAAEALDVTDRAELLAVWATSTQGGWAVLARDGRQLFTVEQNAGLVVWRHLRLTALATASRIGRDRELASRLRVAHGPLSQPIPEAVQVFLRAGVDVADGPPRCF